MKQKLLTSVLLMAVMAAAGVAGAAGGDGHGPRGACCPKPEDMMAPPPEALLCRMTCRLSLSAEQQTKIRALLVKEKENSSKLLSNLAESLNQLRVVEESATFDETAFRTIASKVAQSEVELTVSRARVRSRINALLTAEQRAEAGKFPPPFRGGHGPVPCCGDECGPCHMPSPPCGGEWPRHPDAADEGGR
jgi:Spy/CpxP family protein refolding chaperone